MIRTLLQSTRSRLVVLALIGVGFVVATSACGEETEPEQTLAPAQVQATA